MQQLTPQQSSRPLTQRVLPPWTQAWGSSWGPSQYDPYVKRDTAMGLHPAPPGPVRQPIQRPGARRRRLAREFRISQENNMKRQRVDPPSQSFVAPPHQQPWASTAPKPTPATVDVLLNGLRQLFPWCPAPDGAEVTVDYISSEAESTVSNATFGTPPMKKQRPWDVISPEPQMKKHRALDDVPAKQEDSTNVANTYVLEKGPGGGLFRFSQARDNPQPAWLTSLLVGEVFPPPLFVLCQSIYIYIYIYTYTPQSASVALCISVVKPARQRSPRFITRKRRPRTTQQQGRIPTPT